MTRGFKFELGDTLRDRVTGVQGIVTGRANHLSGCDTYGIQEPMRKDGAVPDTRWFDEPRLELLKKPRLVVDEREVRTGADGVPAPSRSNPK